MEENNRVLGLDILRCSAIMFALLNHTYKYVVPENSKYNHPFDLCFGFLGVELFFILSGFLIGTILIKSFDAYNIITIKQIKRFWIRRWFRTLPNYYLMLIIYIGFDLFINSNNLLSNLSYFSYFVFLQNAITGHPTFFDIAWSLAWGDFWGNSSAPRQGDANFRLPLQCGA